MCCSVHGALLFHVESGIAPLPEETNLDESVNGQPESLPSNNESGMYRDLAAAAAARGNGAVSVLAGCFNNALTIYATFQLYHIQG